MLTESYRYLHIAFATISKVLFMEWMRSVARSFPLKSRTKSLGEDAELMSSGFIRTKQAMVLTSDGAMNLIRAKEGQRLHARLTAEAEANRKATQSVQRESRQACGGTVSWEAIWERPPALCGV